MSNHRLNYFVLTMMAYILSSTVSPIAWPASDYIAYSLCEASRQAEHGANGVELFSLGGITRIAGMVYDRENKDIIIVGLIDDTLPQSHLDDLVVALRARLVYDAFPLVSIDPAADTESTKLQLVRFDGGLEDTSFGKLFLDCDVVLKQYSLDKIDRLEEVPPFTVHIEEDMRDKLSAEGVSVLSVNWLNPERAREIIENSKGMTASQSTVYQARFWFYVFEPYSAACKPDAKNPEVFSINELRICVKAEESFFSPNQQSMVSRNYSQDWTEHFDRMCEKFPVLKHLKLFYDMTALADAITYLEEQPYLNFLLKSYEVRTTKTARTWDLEESFGMVDRSDSKNQLIRVCGGIDFKTELQFLSLGDVTALRDIVLKSRPSDNALVWPLPLEGWEMPNAKDLPKRGDIDTAQQSTTTNAPGCSVVCQSVVLEPKNTTGGIAFKGFTMPEMQLPPLNGVSMQMKVTDESFKEDDTGQLDNLRDSLLRNRGNGQNVTWIDPENNK